MSIREAANLLADVDDVLKKAGRNSTCLYPSCSSTPIGSHIIARKVLKLVADNNSKVLTWNPNLSAWDMARSVDAGESLMQAYAEPISVGIRDKRNVTSPLFCEIHDGPMFAPLEHDEFFCTDEQVLLLAYRALCAKTFTVPPTEPLFAVSRKHGHIHSLSTPEKLSRVLRYQANDVVIEARQRHEDLLLTHDYQHLGWAMFVVDMPPCVASTNALIPADDFEKKAVIDGTLSFSAEDVITFSFFPTEQNNSIGVITWLRDSPRAHRFLEARNIHNLSERERQDDFLSLAFESPTVYISPSWWRSLGSEEREWYTQSQLNACRHLSELV